MKTYIILIVILLTTLVLAGCPANQNINYTVTVAPDSKSHAVTLSEMNLASQILSRRLITSFEIPQENINLDVTETQISLTISNVNARLISSVKKTISAFNRLEFHETYENSEILASLSKANVMSGILKPMVTGSGEPLPSCMIGLASGKDTSEVNKYLKREEVLAVFPAGIRFYWSAKPYKYDKSKSSYGLHAIKIDSVTGQAPLDGTAIISASPDLQSSDANVKINLTMSEEGSTAWATITRENTNRCIAVLYNGYVITYPRVTGEISGRNTEITGDFTIEEATDFANMLNSGQLPFAPKILNEQITKRE